MLRRYSGITASRGTEWPAEVREEIGRLDGHRCVCARAGFPAEVVARCGGDLQLDHVRASGAIGMKSRSTVDNGVTLSAWCHKWKTLNGRTARPLLIAYIDQRNGSGLRAEDIARFRSKVQYVSGEGCWLWRGSIATNGYAVFWLNGRQERASHVALAIDGRPLRPGLFALHHCDNPGCVRPTHLYAGSHQDNMDDRRARGRTRVTDHERVHGSAHPRAKVTEDDVRTIRREYRPGLGGELMRRFGLSQATLWAIVNRRSWRHVEPDPQLEPDCGHVEPVHGCRGPCSRSDPLQLRATGA